MALPAQSYSLIGSVVGSQGLCSHLPHKPGKGQLSNEQICSLLVLSDFSKCNNSRPESAFSGCCSGQQVTGEPSSILSCSVFGVMVGVSALRGCGRGGAC